MKLMNNNLLETYIKFRGFSIRDMAKMTDLSVDDFIEKMRGLKDFRISEMKIMCDALKLKESEIDKIFFGKG